MPTPLPPRCFAARSPFPASRGRMKRAQTRCENDFIYSFARST